MKMWRISGWRWNSGAIVEEIEVEKVTDKTVTYLLKGLGRMNRANKKSEYELWFDTERQALEWLRNFATNAIETAQHKLDKSRADLKSITEQLARLDNDRP